MVLKRTRLFPFAASLSLLASVALAITPLLIPNVQIVFLMIANWVFFMVLGHSISPPAPFLLGRPPAGVERKRWHIWCLALIAFSASGFFALLNSERIS
ncbi:hypothetical protein K3181_13995 [Qipengyuania sp. YG27]|uniref:Uncharacterized protein n=1 Tax=Qipengyuania mesophila TaxID=2867246 RepID=A0ABS7JY71_9SPHN|nr:hypothetical protein [Qipengyuania mesophila]MBX7502551.1 hypothetical protein [Qipengyuania mesophila]